MPTPSEINDPGHGPDVRELVVPLVEIRFSSVQSLSHVRLFVTP